MHQWPKHITGVVIDACGVHDSKEIPGVDFEYTEGYTPLPKTNAQSKKQPIPQLRTLATSGSLPPNQAVKNHVRTHSRKEPQPT